MDVVLLINVAIIVVILVANLLVTLVVDLAANLLAILVITVVALAAAKNIITNTTNIISITRNVVAVNVVQRTIAVHQIKDVHSLIGFAANLKLGIY